MSKKVKKKLTTCQIIDILLMHERKDYLVDRSLKTK